MNITSEYVYNNINTTFFFNIRNGAQIVLKCCR